MNAKDVIHEVQKNCAEYLEMTNDPSAFVAGVLAHKVIKLQEYVEYLEKRLVHANNRTSSYTRKP